MSVSIQTLLEIISQAFSQLQVAIDKDDLEALAVTVHKSMSGMSRRYHSLEHALEFWDPENPIQTLAALYHDLVYFHVDLGYHPDIFRVVSPYLIVENERTSLKLTPFNDDRIYQLTLAVFGYKPGEMLSLENGLNEFLSALFMNLMLGLYLNEVHLLQMTLCIEATIPFRPNEHFHNLEERLAVLNQSFQLNLSMDEMNNMIRTAVSFANIDVKNFAEKDVAVLLDDTWKLLPELNIALRNGIYTVRDYRIALQKMHQLMASLNPDSVFHQFEGVPADEKFEDMLVVARENISLARAYLDVKLLTAAVLEALAEVSGGDAPVALFLGDLTAFPAQESHRIEDFLPEPKAVHQIDEHSRLYQLLSEVSADKSNDDLRNKSLSLFVYKNLDPALAAKNSDAAQRFFAAEITADQFLEDCQGTFISVIARAVAFMVPTRQEKLFEIANLFNANESE